MDITITIEEASVNSFTAMAKESLSSICSEYATFIVDEAKRIESSDRSGTDQAEVIASHVNEAKKNYRKAPKRKTRHIVLDVICELLMLILGAMFSRELLTSNNVYLIVYILLLFATVILLILKYSRGI